MGTDDLLQKPNRMLGDTPSDGIPSRLEANTVLPCQSPYATEIGISSAHHLLRPESAVSTLRTNNQDRDTRAIFFILFLLLLINGEILVLF